LKFSLLHKEEKRIKLINRWKLFLEKNVPLGKIPESQDILSSQENVFKVRHSLHIEK
jgi:hypothetical protein